MYNTLERRKYKRIEKPYMARLRIKQYEGLEISSAEWDMVLLKDLSAGCALFDYSKYLGFGSLLDLKIDISKYTPTINCVGEIIRSDKLQHISVFCNAIKLIDIGEKEKEAIYTAVEEALEQANKTSLT